MTHQFKILATTNWWPTFFGVTGVVAVQTNAEGEPFEWEAYIGNGLGIDEDADAQFVANVGGRLPPDQAFEWFWWLERDKYKHQDEEEEFILF